MLNIPKNYYNSQTRSNFFIEEKMKRAWAAQIEVLEEIKRICNKHNIPFLLFAIKVLFPGTTI